MGSMKKSVWDVSCMQNKFNCSNSFVYAHTPEISNQDKISVTKNTCALKLLPYWSIQFDIVFCYRCISCSFPALFLFIIYIKRFFVLICTFYRLKNILKCHSVKELELDFDDLNRNQKNVYFDLICTFYRLKNILNCHSVKELELDFPNLNRNKNNVYFDDYDSTRKMVFIVVMRDFYRWVSNWC